MYFHTDDPRSVELILDVVRRAHENKQRLRISVSPAGTLDIKRGEGMWTGPFFSTPDSYRDL